jgi:hypothetical protein
MPFKRGDRIEFMHPKTREISGGIFLVSKGGKASFLSDNSELYSGSENSIRASDKPIPPNIQPKMDALVNGYAKGSRVQFEENGVMLYGTVVKGGLNVTVRMDGGESEMRGPSELFYPSQKPIEKDPPSEMDRWGLKGYKAYPSMSEETECFEATITLNGKPVLAARNEGRGGSNSYYPLKGAPVGVIGMFEEDATKWAQSHGTTLTFELHDLWIDFKANKADYGVTSKAYWADYQSLSENAIPDRKP